ncbi:hypothetical protein [Paraburkholderia caballeronis]|uniref:Uncharacterized protein n=1 Tax=Paraburkholderia caballeronis TaxID=416943 RepID=A0A1H7MT91_9BURK|nr:hypothetical protein [Paraburkholderia caballeronis]PXW26431.1 hypothetical protein C7403_104305 [Paraburkholderia caballeronis]PXX01978.1 hypothetical protein C7407_104305 [Paraburkholderia caballeronis]RAK01135.1 hypothetical protein C7409_104305 [Paraburkholderia caballeronis]SEB96036.1 hypothetical protein SAMN05445871_1390 [Paraburkholderia caballeronis]SEL14423.1 hypothetical protein SAMN05192542_105164 [Paraburkholderia caballeronis]
MIWLRPARLLAVAATGTAICMSVLAGWQRGGWPSERLVWVAVGVVLVGGAHLLPALCRPAPLAVRGVGIVLWLGCMVAASYGHATFFLLSQSHAGTLRATSLPANSLPAHRSLPAVMSERASVTAELAVANARRCVRDCPSLRARRVSLAARLDALDAEAGEVRRLQGIEDTNAARRDSARDDPVTARLGALIGMAVSKLDLFAGLTFAAVLEGIACLLWWIALLPSPDRGAAAAGNPVVTIVPSETVGSPPIVAETETELTQLTRDIAAGLVRPTVSGIRQHLHCSQAKAAALRRQIVTPTAGSTA